jgi:hypothetical protein
MKPLSSNVRGILWLCLIAMVIIGIVFWIG